MLFAEHSSALRRLLPRLAVAVAFVPIAGCTSPISAPPGTGPLDVAPTVAVPTASPPPTTEPLVSVPSSPGVITITDHGLMDVVGLTDFEIEASDFAFTPTTLQGTPGQHLRIAIENVSNTTHNVSLDEQGVRQDITPGGRATIEVTFPASGVARFYCAFHTAQGMNGQLETGPPRP